MEIRKEPTQKEEKIGHGKKETYMERRKKKNSKGQWNRYGKKKRSRNGKKQICQRVKVKMWHNHVSSESQKTHHGQGGEI